jgi:hypothetical protein
MIKQKKLFKLRKTFNFLRNIICIAFIILPFTLYSQRSTPSHFICPPCNATCDTLKFDHAGVELLPLTGGKKKADLIKALNLTI